MKFSILVILHFTARWLQYRLVRVVDKRENNLTKSTISVRTVQVGKELDYNRSFHSLTIEGKRRKRQQTKQTNLK